ncbi:MAG: ATPase, partial [Muribaculaceae bacterium]|nr:ATPase [Muribaculaceae bacterium]
MILIADSGSTKIDWCVVDHGKLVKQVFTCGMNALLLTEEEMQLRIATELASEVSEYPIDKVYYYGAGCVSEEVCANVRNAIAASINADQIEVYTDLLAAAHAVCDREPGIACILGTGSNSCVYDGKNITDNVSPLGYILGDEGSGAVLGKILVRDVLKNQHQKHLCDKFLEQYS